MDNYPASLTQTDKCKNIFDTSEFERRIRVLVSCDKRKSDRSMIKCSSFSNGVVKFSRLCVQ